MAEHTHTNRLIHETSPYLLQHAHNPVDWYPWGEEALQRAKAENTPILLSIGYAACHWCHVMERESFENEEIAALMNRHFICIKVDREERPDLDTIYINAVQMMTGGGGWPLTVFLTPDLRPFFGGTYFPPTDRMGMPGFGRLVQAIAEQYATDGENLAAHGTRVVEALQQLSHFTPSDDAITDGLLATGFTRRAQIFDETHGGFGNAPKFPHTMDLALLLRYWKRTGEQNALDMVTLTLDTMAAGGMYDQLGGGFHRYSTDDHWLVPHFEKMLYDNALLARLYLEAFQATGRKDFARIARETLDWTLREMQQADGGFFSTLDADSEGEEGKFYVWSRAEVMETLGDDDGPVFCDFYDITDRGNFEGHNILHVRVTPADFANQRGLSAAALDELLARGRARLLERRAGRIRPGLDDKILTGWNGLMIAAMADGYRILGERRYLEAAARAADFVLTALLRDGLLRVTWREGQAKLNGYLDDYAFMIEGCLHLYEAGFDPRYLDRARALTDTVIRYFWDEEQTGGFFFTGSNHETLVSRTKTGYDGAIPSGNSVMALNLLRLARLLGNEAYGAKARSILQLFHTEMRNNTTAYAQMLCAVDFHLGPTREIVIAGSPEAQDTQTLLQALHSVYLPNKVVALHDSTAASLPDVPLFHDKISVEGKATAYVCENYTCREPVTTPERFTEQLNGKG